MPRVRDEAEDAARRADALAAAERAAEPAPDEFAVPPCDADADPVPVATPRVEVREAGVWDLTPAEYHADPVPAELGGSLSSSGARRLIPPQAPAAYAWWRTHDEPRTTRGQDLGTAMHRELFGVGPEYEVVDLDPSGRWDRKDTKAKLATLRAAGTVPLKPADLTQLQGVVASVRSHHLAGALFDPKAGEAEQALIWQEPESGVWLRALLDYLPGAAPGGVMALADFKTCDRADEDSISRAMVTYGHHLQGAFYSALVVALGLAERVRWLNVHCEREPPFLVHVVEIPHQSMMVGRYLVRQAIGRYAQCTRSGVWPGYGGADPSPVGLPTWELRRFDSLFG